MEVTVHSLNALLGAQQFGYRYIHMHMIVMYKGAQLTHQGPSAACLNQARDCPQRMGRSLRGVLFVTLADLFLDFLSFRTPQSIQCC